MTTKKDLEKALAATRATEDTAKGDHEQLARKHAALAAVHADAVAAYVADPTDENGKTVTAARDAADLAGHRAMAAEQRYAVARAAREDAEAAMASADHVAAVAAARKEIASKATALSAARARSADLARTAEQSTLARRIFGVVLELVADEEQAARIAAGANESASAAAESLEAARDALVQIDPSLGPEIAALRAKEAEAREAEERAHLERLGSVPGIVERLADVVALRRAVAQLGALADELQNAVADTATKARATLGLEPLHFAGRDGRKGAHAVAAAAVFMGLHEGPREAAFYTTIEHTLSIAGLWPPGMPREEALARTMAGETASELHAVNRARSVMASARHLAERTDAATHPVLRARHAVREIVYGRESGAFVHEGREEQLVALATSVEALNAAHELVQKGSGPRKLPGPKGDEDIFVPGDGTKSTRATTVRAMTELLMLDKIGRSVTELPEAPKAPRVAIGSEAAA